MISLFFGLPGCGKTTFLTYQAIRALKRGIDVYTNVPLKLDTVKCRGNCYLIDASKIGDFVVKNGLLLIDEATLQWHNRDFKTFSHAQLEFFMLHRHYRVNIHYFAQSPDTVDKRIREITDHSFYIKRGLLPHTSLMYRIKRGLLFPDGSNVGQIVLGYKKPSLIDRLLKKRLYRVKYYKYFDSYDIKNNRNIVNISKKIK